MISLFIKSDKVPRPQASINPLLKHTSAIKGFLDLEEYTQVPVKNSFPGFRFQNKANILKKMAFFNQQVFTIFHSLYS